MHGLIQNRSQYLPRFYSFVHGAMRKRKRETTKKTAAETAKQKKEPKQTNQQFRIEILFVFIDRLAVLIVFIYKSEITAAIYSYSYFSFTVLVQFVFIVAISSTKRSWMRFYPFFFYFCSKTLLGFICRAASHCVCLKIQWYWRSMSDWSICVVLNRNLLKRSATPIHPSVALLKSCQYKRPSSTANRYSSSTSFFSIFSIANIDLQINVSFKRNKYMQAEWRGRTIG